MNTDYSMELFRILEHTADIGFEAFGKNEKDVLANATLALVSLITDPKRVKSEERKYIDIKADDREQLLVRYLNEVLYLIDGESFVPAYAEVTFIADTSLRAEFIGEKRSDLHDIRTDVKAITYHQLAFEKTDNGYWIRVFVDI
jgi:SHS2 domain-containing protein